ncbi:MAG: SAM-dependent methyltransferase [Azospirillum sp.]|nr:SAM-dependent methyltransferase [Azospirillum sp.]MCA3268481.1 SAM-dependent methyltransferase [Azospirillum sp.]
MSQNRSHAVMAQRHEARDSVDDFPTPPWATRALMEHAVIGQGFRRDTLSEMTCWEPACGRGYMAGVLVDYFDSVRVSDIVRYTENDPLDFLAPSRAKVDWIITNPPFRLGLEFALTALERAKVGVAIFARSNWGEGVERYRRLFGVHKPAIVAQFVERVPLVKGRVDQKASTATSYSWFVWHVDGRWHFDTRHVWIPPCRKLLEREGDYTR